MSRKPKPYISPSMTMTEALMRSEGWTPSGGLPKDKADPAMSKRDLSPDELLEAAAPRGKLFTVYNRDQCRRVADKAVQKYQEWRDSQITCPFCAEGDFDKAGLVHHLDDHCVEYEAVRAEWIGGAK